VNRLRQLMDTTAADPLASAARGTAWQAPQRQREQALRVHVAGLYSWAHAQGQRQCDLAAALGLAPRTLRDWCTLTVAGAAACLGRPVFRSPCAERNAVIALLDELGPRIGVPTLRDCFPQLPRAELADLLRRYRRVWRQRYHQSLHVLHWQRVGAVWAMDFAEAPDPIDGLYPYLLAVRDLASGRSLLWLPLASASAAETIPALEPLFVQHGAPLVLKTDNGSPFLAAETAAFFSLWGVAQLFSPPYVPSYNGAIEAGIGSLKTRTDQHASRQGHPAQWNWDDAAAAQAEANATARPHGANGPTPDDAWSARCPLTDAERALFGAAVAQHREDVRRQGGWCDATELASAEARAIDRQAISRALVEHGFLLYRRRRIPLPFPKRKAAPIT
jgi:transposase InsO family protein